MKKVYILITSALIIFSSASPVSAFSFFGIKRADDARGSEATESSRPRPLSSARAEFKDRLADTRLKFCQNKEEVIKKRMSSLTNLVTTMETKFDEIAKRVEEYYTTKVLPSGKTVANYDALVADIAAKKAIVGTDLALAQTNADSFTCTGDNPKGLLTQFRTDMQTVKKALQNYRTSIKNLITAVRGINEN